MKTRERKKILDSTYHQIWRKAQSMNHAILEAKQNPADQEKCTCQIRYAFATAKGILEHIKDLMEDLHIPWDTDTHNP